jgi:hypothetical protein
VRTDGATQAFILDAGHTPHRYELEIRGCHICAGGRRDQESFVYREVRKDFGDGKKFPPRMENDGRTTEMSGHTLGLFHVCFLDILICMYLPVVA